MKAGDILMVMEAMKMEVKFLYHEYFCNSYWPPFLFG